MNDRRISELDATQVKSRRGTNFDNLKGWINLAGLKTYVSVLGLLSNSPIALQSH